VARVTGRELTFERQIDLPPTVVWPALVDPELLAGWFADVAQRRAADGRIQLSWPDGAGSPPTRIQVRQQIDNESLIVSTDNRGLISVRLESREGGLRGTWTSLTLSVTLFGEATDLPKAEAEWSLALNRLEELLHGRPVDWAAVRRPIPGGRADSHPAHLSTHTNIR
jgi:uncharacterized protein YndB with AHSA1/START domain